MVVSSPSGPDSNQNLPVPAIRMGSGSKKGPQQRFDVIEPLLALLLTLRQRRMPNLLEEDQVGVAMSSTLTRAISIAVDRRRSRANIVDGRMPICGKR